MSLSFVDLEALCVSICSANDALPFPSEQLSEVVGRGVGLLSTAGAEWREKGRVLAVFKSLSLLPGTRQTLLSAMEGLPEDLEVELFASQDGQAHINLVILLCRLSGYTLGAGELLEFLHGNSLLATGCVGGLIGCVEAHPDADELIVCIARMLEGLTLPSSFFHAAPEGASGLADALSGLFSGLGLEVNLDFSAHGLDEHKDVIEELTQAVVGGGVLKSLASLITPRIERAPERLAAIIRPTMDFVKNMFHFSPTTTVDLTLSLIKSRLVQDVCLPFVRSASSASSSAPSKEVLSALIATVRVLGVASHRASKTSSFVTEIRQLLLAGKDGGAAAALAGKARVSLVLALETLALAANLDLLVDDAAAAAAAAPAPGDMSVKALKAALKARNIGIPGGATEKDDLVKLLAAHSSEPTTGLPESALRSMLAAFSREQRAKLDTRFQADPVLLVSRESSQSYPKVLALLQEMKDESKSEGQGRPSPAKAPPSAARPAVELPPPPPALCCALTKSLMAVPVTSPYGHTFDQEAILEHLTNHANTCPITGKPLLPSQLKVDEAKKKDLVTFHIKRAILLNKEPQDLYDF
jgi:hypothetical protein